MKTFREFMIIAEGASSTFGSEEEQKRVAERDAAQARRRAARTGMSPEVEEAENKRKAFERRGLSPEEARRRAYRNVKVSGQDVRSGSQTRTQTPPRQPSGSSTQTPPRSTQTRTQTPPRGAQTGTQTPPKQPKASTPPPPKTEPKASQSAYKGRNVGNKVPDDYEEYMRKYSGTPKNMADMDEREFNRRYGDSARAQTARDIGKQQGYGSSKTSSSPPKAPTSNVPAPTAKPATPQPKGPGLRARLGRLAGPAATVAGGALEYKARRDQGQSRARAGGGALASGAGFAKGASLGFRMTPGPLPVKVAGAAVGGLVGDTAASAAYDYAADKTRPARQAVARATGYDKFQQKNALIKPGSGLSGIARAQQTVDTRGARQIAARSGVYGANKGSALTGIGGQTTTSRDTKGNTFMSTGAGSQRKTVQLAKTQLVRDPKTGKQVVGDLAFKGGKATYLARPSISSRDGNLFSRLSRATGIGGQRERDAAAAKQEYRTALRNTQTYQKKLGITPQAATKQKLPGRGVGPAKVGPKKVGPKLVGPKIVGPKKK